MGEAPLPKTERRPMTQGCADAMAALESADGGKFAGAVAMMKTPAADWHQSPLEVIGCAEGATRAEMENGLNLFLAAAEICPEYCIPGTDTETTGYKNTGTGGRFAAGISTTMCDWTKNIVEGWFAGAGSDAMLQSDPEGSASGDFAEAKQLAAEKAAAAAKEQESEHAAEEAKFHAEAAKLGDESNALADEAATANAKADADAAAFGDHVMKEVSDAAAQTAAAIKAKEASDAEYESITAKLKEEGENASAESEARKA